jgi:hypothetical protein
LFAFCSLNVIIASPPAKQLSPASLSSVSVPLVMTSTAPSPSPNASLRRNIGAAEMANQSHPLQGRNDRPFQDLCISPPTSSQTSQTSQTSQEDAEQKVKVTADRDSGEMRGALQTVCSPRPRRGTEQDTKGALSKLAAPAKRSGGPSKPFSSASGPTTERHHETRRDKLRLKEEHTHRRSSSLEAKQPGQRNKVIVLFCFVINF